MPDNEKQNEYMARQRDWVDKSSCLICNSIVTPSNYDEYDRKVRELGEMRDLAERCTKHVTVLENKITELQQELVKAREALEFMTTSHTIQLKEREDERTDIKTFRETTPQD